MYGNIVYNVCVLFIVDDMVALFISKDVINKQSFVNLVVPVEIEYWGQEVTVKLTSNQMNNYKSVLKFLLNG